MEEKKVTFTWLTFFEELADKVLTYRNDQKKLLDILRNTGFFKKGLDEKDDQGNKTPLDEIDPFSFFSVLMKFKDLNKKKIFESLKTQFGIFAELSEDYNGVPSSIPNMAWLVAGKSKRQPSDIDTLWDLFEAALNNSITEGLFEKALGVNQVGFTKITQGLFRIRPKIYFPIDKQTEPFLKKHGVSFACKKTKKYSDYKECLDNIGRQFPDNEFYELSHQAWSENQSNKLKYTPPGWLAAIIKNHCLPERIEYRKECEKQLRKMLIEKDCQFSQEEWEDFFKIINKDYWNNKKTTGRFGQGFTGNNTKLMLKDVNKLNKWAKEIWTCDEIDLQGVVEDFWEEKILGSGIGFPTMLLYLRDSKSYNVWLENMHKGFKKVKHIPFSRKKIKSYLKYNSALVEFRTQNNLEPQTLDIIFCLDDPATSTSTSEKHEIKVNNTTDLNQILYGPPGTGKTYQTVNYALSIIENTSPDEVYQEGEIDGRKSLLKRFNQYKDNDQIEFVTFHQNYAYEDFIQGLRPNTESGSNTLSFKLNDGVFKLIADRALENYKASRHIKENADNKPSFRKVFDSYFKKLIEAEVESVPIKMKKASYKITEISEKTIFFEKQTGISNHSLSISTLADMYEKEKYTLRTKGGLQPYYVPLLEELLEHAKTLSTDSTSEELKQYIIIIDEINRANISRVFGELITLIEEDKRFGGINEMTATLPSGEPFSIPPNLSIIGTMNTADKSIALIDIALRRRFEFIKIYPEVDLVVQPYRNLFIKINEQIIKEKGPDFQIGHAYFMKKANQDFRIANVMNNKIIPLLYEYFMNDGDMVNKILKHVGIETNSKYGLWEYKSYPNG